MVAQPVIEAFFDEATNTDRDPVTREAAIIDPVLDLDLANGEADIRSAEHIFDAALAGGWRIVMVLETRAYADHLSARALHQGTHRSGDRYWRVYPRHPENIPLNVCDARSRGGGRRFRPTVCR